MITNMQSLFAVYEEFGIYPVRGIAHCFYFNFFSFFSADKAPSEATFRGTEFLSYDLNRTGGEPIVSSQDIISLNFKTRFPNGLLFYTGESHRKLENFQNGVAAVSSRQGRSRNM